MVTSDEKATVGVLRELPGFGEGDDLLRAARVRGAIELLHRAGFELVLLPDGAAFQLARKRRCWRRERSA